MTNLQMTLLVLGCVAAGCSDKRAGDRGAGDMAVGSAGDLAGLSPGSDLDGGSGDLAGAPASWKPQPGTSWQIQLSGTVDTSVQADIYDIDLYENSAQVIAGLKAQGRRVICYFSAGSYEDWRPDASSFPKAAIGMPLDGWPGEWWLDVRDATVRQLMAARMDLAVQKQCDAVDPDNVDGYSNPTGFPLTSADQEAFNRFLADAAHARGLAVGLKNDVDQVADLVTSFDFQVNEQCFDYGECDKLAPFVSAHKPVFQISYGDQTLASQICPQAKMLGFDALIKNMALDAMRIACN